MTEDEIKSQLFKLVERPKNLHSVKIVNVYDNRYRINLWVTEDHEGLSKNKIKASYFAKLTDNKLIL